MSTAEAKRSVMGLAVACAWFALAVGGQAAALTLVRAGFMVGYQHYAPPRELLAPAHGPALLLLGVQALAVAIGLRTRIARIAAWLRTETGAFRAAAVGLIFVLSSATLSRNPADYVAELVLASIIQVLALATVLLAVSSLDAGTAGTMVRWLDGAASDGRAEPAVYGATGSRPDRIAPTRRVDPFILAAALWVTTLCAVLAVVSYGRHPHVPDEVVYLLHARYFAAGMLDLPLPPVPDAFNLDLMTYEATRWYSPVPPGWPAVLAVGAFFGVPWLVNPVLNGINVLLAAGLLRAVYGRRAARLGVLLLACSPWFVFMGMNLMTHTLTMTAALAGALAVARVRRATGAVRGAVVAAGVSIGILGMIRPLEGLTVAVLLGLWALGSPVRQGLWRRLVPVAGMAFIALGTACVQLPYNRYLSGSAMTFPLMAYTDSVYGAGTNALGFGANRGLGWPGLDPFPGHGIADVLVNSNLNLFQVNTELLGWSTGSLLPVLVLFGLGVLQRRDLWMLTVIAAVVGVHSLYWFSGGPDFGARYWYLVLVPCIALAARGIETLAARSDARAYLAALALCASALLTFFPWRATDKYHHYRNMRPDVRTLAATHDFGRSLVLVRGNRHPDYASAAAYNPLDLGSPVPVYAWDRSRDVRIRVLEAYADRPVWVIDGPTRTGHGFRIVRGPVPAAELLQEERAAGPEGSR